MTDIKPIKFLSNIYRKCCLLVLSLLLFACSSPEESAKKHLDKGYSLLKSGENGKAMVEFKNSLQIKANSVDALYGLALAFQANKDWVRMHTLCTRVIELDANHVDANLKLLFLYLAANEMEKALDRIKVLEKIAPKNADFLAYKASFLLKSGDTAGAIDVANYALTLNPKNSQARIVIISESVARQQYAEALTIVDEGLKLDPKNEALALLRIDTLEKNHQMPQAMQLMLKLVKENPDNIDYLKHQVSIYLLQDDKENAEKVLKTIVEKDSKNNQAVFDLIRFVLSYKGEQYALNLLDSYINRENSSVDLKFFKAVFLKRLNKEQAANQELMQIIHHSENLESAMRAKSLLATDAFQHGDSDTGYRLIQEILKEDARNETALLLKAANEMHERNYKAAIADLRVILKDSPNSGAALVALGRAHELSGEIDLADKQFKHAVDASNMDYRYVLPYVEFLLRNKQPERAADVIEPVMISRPSDPEVLRHLASIKMARGDLLGAESLAKEIKVIDHRIGDEMLGAIYVNQKNFNEGIAAFERNYSANPKSSEALVSLVKALVKADRKDEAVKTLQQIITNNPQTVGPRILLAQVMIKMHDNQSAINIYQEVIRANPNLIDGYQQLGEFLRDIGRLDQAVEILKQGMSSVKNDYDLSLILASVYEKKGNIDNAIGIYSDLIKTHPDSEVVKNNYISLVTEFKTDPDLLKNAYALSSSLKEANSPFVQDTVGWSAYKVGKYQEARSALLNATELNPKIAVFHYHLGMIHAALSDKEKAMASLQTALKLKVNNQEIPVDLINNKLRELNG